MFVSRMFIMCTLSIVLAVMRVLLLLHPVPCRLPPLASLSGVTVSRCSGSVGTPRSSNSSELDTSAPIHTSNEHLGFSLSATILEPKYCVTSLRLRGSRSRGGGRDKRSYSNVTAVFLVDTCNAVN